MKSKRDLIKGILQGNPDDLRMLKQQANINYSVLEKYDLDPTMVILFFEEKGNEVSYLDKNNVKRFISRDEKNLISSSLPDDIIRIVEIRLTDKISDPIL